METQEQPLNEQYKFRPRNSPAGRVLGGLVIIGAGAVLLAHKLGVYFPGWLFTWPSLLIVLGLFIGAKHLFRGFGWMIPIVIGSAFLIDNLFPGFNFKPYILPVLLIMAGIFMVFNRGSRWGRHRHFRHYGTEAQRAAYMQKWQHQPELEKKSPLLSTDDVLDITAVFGGVKKTLISKDFKGGEVTCVMAGAEINLSQSDINGRVKLELNHVMGGSKLIVPSNWHIQSEITAVLGGVEDNRNVQQGNIDYNKTLVLEGNLFMGGITIMSY